MGDRIPAAGPARLTDAQLARIGAKALAIDAARASADEIAWVDDVIRLTAALRAAWADNERYRAALEHYADAANWDADGLDTPEGAVRVYEPIRQSAVLHGWEMARAALAAPGAGEETAT